MLDHPLSSHVSTCLDDVPFSVFEHLVERLKKAQTDQVIGLHQGKTTFPPCPDVRNWGKDAFELTHHTHAPPQGIASLKEAIHTEHVHRGRQSCDPEQLMICAGATHAISMAAQSVLKPGDEALILSPQWLFARGVLKSCHAKVREVPFFLELCKNPDMDLDAYLKESITARTRLIYFNTPNNPTGYSMTRAQLQTLVRFCHAHKIWLIADNAYEFYDYSLDGFIDARDLEGGDEICFSVYSFSKSYIMPGYRVGYVISPKNRAVDMKKRGLHSVYSIATPSQYGAWQALHTPVDKLIVQRRETLVSAQLAKEKLSVPHCGFSGGFYLFLDLSALGGQGIAGFYDRLLQQGISLAPGEVFGTGMENYARLCFTAVERDLLERAITQINEVYRSL